MATFTWTLQGTTPTTIDATDKVQLAGSGGFDSKITVGQYNQSTHVKTAANANKSSGNSPRNNRFTSSTQVSIDGAAAVNLNTASNANCALRINFSDAASVAITGAVFYAYDGTTPATAPVGITFKAAEQGDASWTDAEGSGSPVTLNDKTANTSHDFYVLLSGSPDSVGLKSYGLRCELTYS